MSILLIWMLWRNFRRGSQGLTIIAIYNVFIKGIKILSTVSIMALLYIHIITKLMHHFFICFIRVRDSFIIIINTFVTTTPISLSVHSTTSSDWSHFMSDPLSRLMATVIDRHEQSRAAWWIKGGSIYFKSIHEYHNLVTDFNHITSIASHVSLLDHWECQKWGNLASESDITCSMHFRVKHQVQGQLKREGHRNALWGPTGGNN